MLKVPSICVSYNFVYALAKSISSASCREAASKRHFAPGNCCHKDFHSLVHVDTVLLCHVMPASDLCNARDVYMGYASMGTLPCICV